MNKIHKAATATFVMSALRRYLGYIAYDKHKREVTEAPTAGVFETIESELTNAYGPIQEIIGEYLNYSMCWDETRDGSKFWFAQHQLWKEEWRRIFKSGLPEAWREMLDTRNTE